MTKKYELHQYKIDTSRSFLMRMNRNDEALVERINPARWALIADQYDIPLKDLWSLFGEACTILAENDEQEQSDG